MAISPADALVMQHVDAATPLAIIVERHARVAMAASRALLAYISLSPEAMAPAYTVLLEAGRAKMLP